MCAILLCEGARSYRPCRMAELSLQEIIAVAEARDISLPENALQTAIIMYDDLVPQATASLQRDVMEGRPSELESQIGAVVRFGKKLMWQPSAHIYLYLKF